MSERSVDKSSLIKLSLYMFTSFMSRKDVRHMTLNEVVTLIESRKPKSFPNFCTFSMKIRPVLHRRSR